MVTSIRAVFQEELWQSAKRIAFAAVAMICCCTAYGQQSVKGGSYYALVIGINQYRPPVPRLQTAVNDAEEVAGLLTNLYGFRVKLLTDDLATRDNILGSLDEYRRTLRSNDNLLVYYAGHGYADKEEEKAYWLPVDAERDTRSRWIIADELTTKMRADPARHVLVISDSCFSGGLLREAGIQIRPVDQQTYMTKMLAGRSRTLMSSGGNEPVTDGGDNGHSVFANAVIRALLDTNMKEFTAEDLFHNFVLRQVAGSSDQIPKYSSIRNSGDDSGDFVFSRVGDINPTNSGRPPSSPTLSSSVTNNPDLDNAGTSSAAVPHKNGKIYLINYSRQFAKILCDQSQVTPKLEQSRWFAFELPPGKHTLTVASGSALTKGVAEGHYDVNVADGQEVFLRLDDNHRLNWHSTIWSVQRLSNQQGLEDIEAVPFKDSHYAAATPR